MNRSSFLVLVLWASLLGCGNADPSSTGGIELTNALGKADGTAGARVRFARPFDESHEVFFNCDVAGGCNATIQFASDVHESPIRVNRWWNGSEPEQLEYSVTNGPIYLYGLRPGMQSIFLEVETAANLPSNLVSFGVTVTATWYSATCSDLGDEISCPSDAGIDGGPAEAGIPFEG